MTTKSLVNKDPANRPSMCTCINVRRASRAITRIYDKALEPAGLKVTQFSVLVAIARSNPLSISKLARILKLDRTTLVRNIKFLASSGFIENTAVPDPRERAISSTESGRMVIEKAVPYWRIAQKQVVDHVGEENVKQLSVLVTALEKLVADGDPADADNHPLGVRNRSVRSAVQVD